MRGWRNRTDAGGVDVLPVYLRDGAQYSKLGDTNDPGSLRVGGSESLFAANIVWWSGYLRDSSH